LLEQEVRSQRPPAEQAFSLSTDPSPLVEPLSERELQVLRLVANGLSNREIADALVLAVGTVKAHVHTIFGKLDVRGRTQAVARARDLDLL
jgi:LuxR family maltose regulon positive regulatory protein